jgi:hypothetical protein
MYDHAAQQKDWKGRRLMVETINQVLKNFVHTNDKKLTNGAQHKPFTKIIVANNTLMDRLALTEVDSKDTD